ncbi:MAG: efflux transporter outer membrane subunit [Alphaproteobacteria bacterium]|nr:efflux transporter outer membrane subunit [Alphaproteobacteria bacterium]
MAFKTQIGSVVAALLASGCTVIGPDYKSPGTTDYEAPGFINAAGYDGEAPLADWWTLADDPVLDALVARSLAENNSLGSAYANVNAARAQWGLARLNRAPFDTISGSYLESRTSSAVFAASTGQAAAQPFPTNDISDLGVSATWEVDLFGRVTRTINIAKADLGEAQALLADLRAVVVADAVDAYVNLRGLEVQLEVAEENVRVQQSTLRVTEATRDAGRGTDLDVDLAQAQLSGTLAAIPPLKAAISAATYQLGVLTGQTPAEISAIVADSAPLPLFEGEIAIGDPAQLLRRRPDISAAERALASATERIGLNIVEAFPRIDIIGQAGYQAVGFNSQFSENALNFAAGPSVTWSLTNLVRAHRTVRAAKAGADAAFEAYEGTILSALAEAEIAFARQARLQERLVHLSEADRASGEAARLARIRYENGATNFLNVLDAERRQIEAATALATGETELARARVAVFRALRAGPSAN